MKSTLIPHSTNPKLRAMKQSAIELRKMTRKDFSKYSKPQLENYAQAIAKNFKRPVSEVRTEARRQVKRILKNGLSTPGHFLFNVVERTTGQTIGHVWFYVSKDKKGAFLYDIVVHKPFRGKGYGRRTLRMVETKLRQMGVNRLGLHVFNDNRIAISLYRSEGFRVGSVNMQKIL
jgi:ribosomal protein S18 acetylase RimI-like enzyme